MEKEMFLMDLVFKKYTLIRNKFQGETTLKFVKHLLLFIKYNDENPRFS